MVPLMDPAVGSLGPVNRIPSPRKLIPSPATVSHIHGSDQHLHSLSRKDAIWAPWSLVMLQLKPEPVWLPRWFPFCL